MLTPVYIRNITESESPINAENIQNKYCAVAGLILRILNDKLNARNIGASPTIICIPVACRVYINLSEVETRYATIAVKPKAAHIY